MLNNKCCPRQPTAAKTTIDSQISKTSIYYTQPCVSPKTIEIIKAIGAGWLFDCHGFDRQKTTETTKIPPSHVNHKCLPKQQILN